MTTTYGSRELVHVNVFAPTTHECARELCDGWANELLEPFPCAPDYDGTTGGNTDGINVLLFSSDLPALQRCAAEFGADVVTAGPVTSGHYGDGQYHGVDVEVQPDGSYLIQDRGGALAPR